MRTDRVGCEHECLRHGSTRRERSDLAEWGATQSAGLGIPKRSHTVLVTDATVSMPRIISDSGGRSKVPAPGSTSPVAPKRANPYTRGMLGATGNLTWNIHLATADDQATL